MSDQGRYRKLYARIWRNADFLALSDADRMLALYLLTGPQANRIGLFYFVAETAGVDLRRVQIGERVAKVCAGMRWFYDRRARVIWIPSWWRWNPPANVNQLIGSLKDLQELPPTILLTEFAQNVEPLPGLLREPFTTLLLTRFAIRVPKPSAKPSANPVTVTGSVSVTVEKRANPKPVEKPVENSGRATTATKEKKTAQTDDAEPATDETLQAIARETVTRAPMLASTENLITNFLTTAERHRVRADRSTAIRILESIGARP